MCTDNFKQLQQTVNMFDQIHITRKYLIADQMLAVMLLESIDIVSSIKCFVLGLVISVLGTEFTAKPSPMKFTLFSGILDNTY